MRLLTGAVFCLVSDVMAFASDTVLRPTITFIGNTQPHDWYYAAPTEFAITWFAAEYNLPRTADVAFDSFIVNQGGQIVDIIRNNNDRVFIRGYVPSADPYEATSTVVQISSKLCALQPSCTAFKSADVVPHCSIYPVDMSYCGSEGLMTDRENAVLVVGCSKAISGLCFPEAKDCIFVDGPRNTSVNYVSAEVAVLDSVFYHIQVSWEPSYLGPAIISIECNLEDADGNTLGVPIKALQFQILVHVAVRATAYKVGVHRMENM